MLFKSIKVCCLHPSRYVVYSHQGMLFTSTKVCCLYPQRYVIYIHKGMLFISTKVYCLRPPGYVVYIHQECCLRPPKYFAPMNCDHKDNISVIYRIKPSKGCSNFNHEHHEHLEHHEDASKMTDTYTRTPQRIHRIWQARMSMASLNYQWAGTRSPRLAAW